VVRIASTANHVGRLVALQQTAKKRLEPFPLGLVNHVVGIQPEGIIALGTSQGRVAGRGEVVHPGEVEYPRAKFPSDFRRAIGRPGINDHDLVEQAFDRGEASWQIGFLITHDHRQADLGPPGTDRGTSPGRRDHFRSAWVLRTRCRFAHRHPILITNDQRLTAGSRWTAPRLERHALDVLDLTSPLLSESLLVVLQKPLRVDAVALERPAAEVVDEQVMGDSQLKTGTAGALGQVVVVEEPQAEPFIQSTDRLVDPPLHEKAEPRELAHREPLPSVLFSPSACEYMHLIHILVGRLLHPLGRGDVVGHRPGEAHVRPRVDQSDKLVEPGIGHDHVIVQQNEILAPCDPQSLVDRGGEAEVPSVADDRHRHRRSVLDPGEVGRATIGGTVVDDDQFPGLARVPDQGGEAEAREPELAAARDNDGSKTRTSLRVHRCSSLIVTKHCERVKPDRSALPGR
jgi:hypothetical protein